VSSGDLLLDLEQERSELRIGLHRRNGFSGNIVGREGTPPYQQEAGADRYQPPRQTRPIPAPPLCVRVAAKSARMELITKYELEHILVFRSRTFINDHDGGCEHYGRD
jgi:hypothetical protein